MVVSELVLFNSLVSWNLINTGWGSGLMPDGKKPLPKPKLIYHQMCFCGIYLIEISRKSTHEINPQHRFWDHYQISQRPMRLLIYLFRHLGYISYYISNFIAFEITVLSKKSTICTISYFSFVWYILVHKGVCVFVLCCFQYLKMIHFYDCIILIDKRWYTTVYKTCNLHIV